MFADVGEHAWVAAVDECVSVCCGKIFFPFYFKPSLYIHFYINVRQM